jgi:dsRNA-specific ribonuclease
MEDVFEAFIGAIMMDFQSYPKDSVTLPDHVKSIDPVFDGAGYYVAQTWIINIIEKYIDFSDLIQAKTNFKDMLVRYMQHTFQDSPRFFEISVETRHNSKVFKYCVKNRAGTTLGTATGASKKEAENNAAHAALQYYGAAVENGYKDK